MAVPGGSTYVNPIGDPLVLAVVKAPAPTKLGGELFVEVPGAAAQIYGPVVSWLPLPEPKTMPTAGKGCLIAFDETGNPWLIAWAS
jgi:hypothetical protein